MKKLTILSILTMLFTMNMSMMAQDTILVKKDGKTETVLCKITKVTPMNIFYTENKIGKNIAIKDVSYYTNHNIFLANTDKNVIKDTISKIQDLKLQPDNRAKNWLILSGTSFILSGVCSLINANLKMPIASTYTNVNSYQSDLDSYIKTQKSLHNISSGLTVIGGLSIIVGININFETKKVSTTSPANKYW